MKKPVRLGIGLIALVVISVVLAIWAGNLRAQQIEVGSGDDGAAEAALNAQADMSTSARATVAILTLTMTPAPLTIDATAIP